ncbi:cyclin-dependent kinase inhibitor 1C-like protein [Labeo rohita]|uniref:Cyclin-dependent kinase inhibitor 1C-like protein n=1 Tax=Labeo rohita TaxID=84645 RepID=A0A498N983_LABRO|nr:cyclin-dependent kinase inhibitor 1C-like protein [Labeo rohita]
MDMDQTFLRVRQAEASKRAERKFCKPHWPPVISPEESERRRQFRKSLKRESSPQTSLWRQWPPVLKNVKVSVPQCASLAVLPPPKAVADAAVKRVPRATAWRRKKRAEEDKKALKYGKAIARRANPKRFTCRLCGQPKRLEFGHSFYKGKSFCATSAGKSVTQWLSEQKRMAEPPEDESSMRRFLDSLEIPRIDAAVAVDIDKSLESDKILKGLQVM